jgi:hypothetical protein
MASFNITTPAALLQKLLQEQQDFTRGNCLSARHERWSCFLRQAVKVDSAMKRVIHHEDAETVFG